MAYLRQLRAFNSGGLLGDITPFRSTRANYSSFGTYDWKWIFVCSVYMQVQVRGGTRDFYRVSPAQGYNCDQLRVARGSPA
jgi:hypothetical protein